MTTQIVAPVGTPTLPRVNLLPPEIGEAQRTRRIQAMCAVAVAVAAVGVGAIYFAGQGSVASARHDLDAAQQRNATLSSQAARLNGVTLAKNQLSSAQATLDSAMGSAVDWSPLLNDMALSLPSNVWLTQLQLQATGPAAATPASGTGTSPLTTAVPVGTVTIEGTGLTHLDAAALVQFLTHERGLAGAYFTSSHERVIPGASHHVDDFQATATVTGDALLKSKRAGG